MKTPRLCASATHTMILLLSTIASVQAQDRVISGTVFDAGSLRLLDGAEVSVSGTSQRTHTDASGRFAIADVDGAQVTLDVRRLGYRPLTQTVRSGERGIRLGLVGAAIRLDEVVVTGTAGATQTRAIGNAVAKIAAADLLQAMPVVDVQQLLSARVPGVVVLPYSGNAGTGGTVRVRGASSLSLPNTPLVYVDGARVDNNPAAGPSIRSGRQVSRMNDIDPEDIESVEILKGPAAATLYGTEASRGVIQILTRRGTVGPPRFGVTIKQGANWFMNPEGRIPWLYGLAPTGALDSLNLFLQEEAAGRHMFRTGHPQTYDVNVSGGTEAVRYYLSTDFDRDEGIVSYNWRNRLSTRANVSLLPSDKLEVRTSLSFVHNATRLAQAAEAFGLWEQIVLGHPNGPTRGFNRATPEDVATIESLSEIERFIGSIQLQHRPFHWFTQRLTLGADVGDETSSLLYPRSPLGANGPFGGLSLGDKTLEHLQARFSTFDYSASVSFALAPPFRSTTSVGAQHYSKRQVATAILGRFFPAPDVTALAGAAVTSGSETWVENKTVGVFGQQQVSWKNRLFMTGALRADDNSAFGANFDYVIYPKLEASWVVNEESLWKLALVNALKVRAAWGRAGQQPDVFAAVPSYQPATGPGDTPVLVTQNVGNPDLKPERGEELEVGFDAGLFRDRVGVRFTHYRQVTKDAIVARSVAPSVGFPGTQPVNLGRVRNWGTELSIDARLVDSRPLAWDLGLTLATNDSRIESLGGLPPISVADVNGPSEIQLHKEGYPIAAYFRKQVVSAALGANRELVNVRCAGGPENNDQPVPCDSLTPLVFVGPSIPRWEGSVRATVIVFGNLKLSGLVDFRGGHIVGNQDVGLRIRASGSGHNARALYDSSDAILLAYNDLFEHDLTFAQNSAYLVKGGFAKLREVSASYVLPPAWASAFGASRVAVTVAGRNLATLWKAQKDLFGAEIIDPEGRTSESFGLSGLTRFSLPQYAQLVTSVRVTF